jgi:hypothetical protein
MKGQSRERMQSEHRRQEMAGSGSSPSHPSSLVIPDRGLETNREVGGGYGLGLHGGPYVPNYYQRDGCCVYRPLGCDLNSKFFLYIIHVNSKD